MPATTLTDVIVPEIFTPYVIERTAELSEFFTSGIVSPVSELTFGDRGGSTVEMPFWQDLTGDDQVLDTNTDLDVNNMNADQDTAVLNARALVYGSKDLVAALAGSDPQDAVATLIADKWSRRWQAALVATLNGAMGALAAESPGVNNLDISLLSGGASIIDGESFIDASYQLGDAETRLVAVAMHSHTYALLRKLDLIDFIPDSQGRPFPTYMQKRVIIDDGMPHSNGVYTTYLFGDGAIGYGEGSPKVPTEVERNGLKGGGEEYLISRRHFVLHPRGIRWRPKSGVPAKDTPSNAELADADNWSRVYEPKNIRIVAFKHRVMPA